jgi:hypothetical protein
VGAFFFCLILLAARTNGNPEPAVLKSDLEIFGLKRAFIFSPFSKIKKGGFFIDNSLFS